METNEFKMYNIKEISEILKLSDRTIWEYVKAGKLKAVKIGREWRVKEQTLKDFIDGK